MKSNKPTYSNNKIKTLFIVLLSCYGLAFLCINFQDHYFNSNYKEKIWVHRVNSIEKLKQVNSNYTGIELDIIYDSVTNTFDVNHPPAKSIGLTFFNYLSAIELNNKNNFWLDFKNLSATNSHKASKKLDSICHFFNLNNKQFIIESTKPQYLNSFSNKAYKTSYYLPRNLCELDSSSLRSIIQSIQLNCTNHKTSYISADKRDYKIIKKNFPNREILTWSFPMEPDFSFNPISLFNKAKKSILKHKIMTDQNVKVVLFDFKSKAEER